MKTRYYRDCFFNILLWISGNRQLTLSVKFDDGLEGWVWGRYVTLFESTSGYDPKKVERYIEYNTVK